MTRDTVRVTRLYYGFQFFFGMLLWVPIFYDYQRKVGLGDSEIFRIQSIYYLAFCLMEIPTGFLADFWGHRLCMKSGAAVLTVANCLPIFLPSYNGFLAHFLLVALARSLISGASSAYLYEYLSARGETATYKRAEGNARSYGLFGKVVFWAGIGALMEWHLSLPYWLTAACSAISIGYALAMPALPASAASAPAAKSRSQVWRQLVPVLALLARTPALGLIMVQGIAVFVLARICQINLFQPILAEKSFDLKTYGMVMALITVFEALGSAFPHLLKRWWNDLNAVFILTAVMAFSLGAIAFSGQWGAVAWLSVFSLATGFSFPIQRQLLNDAIPDSRFRATFLSIESLMDRAVCAWVASLLGAYVASGRTDSFLQLSAAVSLLGVFVLYAALRFYPQFVRRLVPEN
jgi:MFS family permease